MSVKLQSFKKDLKSLVKENQSLVTVYPGFLSQILICFLCTSSVILAQSDDESCKIPFIRLKNWLRINFIFYGVLISLYLNFIFGPFTVSRKVNNVFGKAYAVFCCIIIILGLGLGWNVVGAIIVSFSDCNNEVVSQICWANIIFFFLLFSTAFILITFTTYKFKHHTIVPTQNHELSPQSTLRQQENAFTKRTSINDNEGDKFLDQKEAFQSQKDIKQKPIRNTENQQKQQKIKQLKQESDDRKEELSIQQRQNTKQSENELFVQSIEDL